MIKKIFALCLVLFLCFPHIFAAEDYSAYIKLTYETDFTATGPEGLAGSFLDNIFDGKTGYPNDYYGPGDATVMMTISSSETNVGLVRVHTRNEPGDVALCNRIAGAEIRGYTQVTDGTPEVIGVMGNNLTIGWYDFKVSKRYARIALYNAGSNTDIGEIELYKSKPVQIGRAHV